MQVIFKSVAGTMQCTDPELAKSVRSWCDCEVEVVGAIDYDPTIPISYNSTGLASGAITGVHGLTFQVVAKGPQDFISLEGLINPGQYVWKSGSHWGFAVVADGKVEIMGLPVINKEFKLAARFLQVAPEPGAPTQSSRSLVEVVDYVPVEKAPVIDQAEVHIKVKQVPKFFRDGEIQNKL